MRLIDADAIEELFRETISHIAKNPKMEGTLEHMVRASAMVIEMIKDAPTIEPQKWIPLSERLPDLDEYVLCTVNDQGEGNEVAMMCLTTSIRSDDYYWTDYACEYSWELCEVFAWMPLPEPWGGDSDDNH